MDAIWERKNALWDQLSEREELMGTIGNEKELNWWVLFECNDELSDQRWIDENLAKWKENVKNCIDKCSLNSREVKETLA